MLGFCDHHKTDIGKGGCAACDRPHGMEAAQR
jgi:hypothetical protein